MEVHITRTLLKQYQVHCFILWTPCTTVHTFIIIEIFHYHHNCTCNTDQHCSIVNQFVSCLDSEQCKDCHKYCASNICDSLYIYKMVHMIIKQTFITQSQTFYAIKPWQWQKLSTLIVFTQDANFYKMKYSIAMLNYNLLCNSILFLQVWSHFPHTHTHYLLCAHLIAGYRSELKAQCLQICSIHVS